MKHFTTSDGLSLAYRDEGEGLPVLCIPGLSRNGLDFQPVVDEFSGIARIIRLDLRGRGASDYDPDFTNYNLHTEARDVVELLDHLSLEKAVILGTSRGGLIAMMLGAVAPERLLGAVLNDVGPELDPTGLGRIMDYLGIRPKVKTLDQAVSVHSRHSVHQFPGVSDAQWHRYLSNGLRETSDGLELCYDPKLRDAVLASMESGPTPDLWPLIDLLANVPLGVLRGANSDLLSAETFEKMIARRPDMAHATVADRGHIPFLDEAEAIGLLRSFFQGLSGV